jgi:DNA-binding XRE family transcriptional regulator
MGLNQTELARRTGVPRTTLRDAELRLHVPAATTQRACTSTCGCT